MSHAAFQDRHGSWGGQVSSYVAIRNGEKDLPLQGGFEWALDQLENLEAVVHGHKRQWIGSVKYR